MEVFLDAHLPYSRLGEAFSYNVPLSPEYLAVVLVYSKFVPPLLTVVSKHSAQQKGHLPFPAFVRIILLRLERVLALVFAF